MLPRFLWTSSELTNDQFCNKQLLIEFIKHSCKVQPLETVQKPFKTNLFQLENTCCKATINKITYLTLHLRIAQKSEKKRECWQYTMMICHSFIMVIFCNLTTCKCCNCCLWTLLSMVHQIFCSTYLHHSLLHVHKILLFITRIGMFYLVQPPFIDWDSIITSNLFEL